MSRYDEHTTEFMRKIAGDPKEDAHLDKSRDAEPKDGDKVHLGTKPLRVARALIRGVEDPHGALGKLLVGGTAKYIMNKEGSLNILKLYEFLNNHYERAWWEWEAETVWKTLQEDHFSEGTPEEIKDAIMALQVTVTTQYPFEHWHIFEKVGHAFNLNHVDFNVLQPLEPDEVALTISILKRIQPKTDFEPEVLIYVAACAREAGMVYLPDEYFPGAQRYLNDLTFDYDLRDRVKKLWDNGHKNPGSTDAEKIQIERLIDVKSYRSGLEG